MERDCRYGEKPYEGCEDDSSEVFSDFGAVTACFCDSELCNGAVGRTIGGGRLPKALFLSIVASYYILVRY